MDANTCKTNTQGTDRIQYDSAIIMAEEVKAKAVCTTAGDDGCAYKLRASATTKATCILGDCATVGSISCMKCGSKADCELSTKGGSNEDCVWDTTTCKIGECTAASTKFACGVCSAADCVLATVGGLLGRNCVAVAAVTATFVNA